MWAALLELIYPRRCVGCDTSGGDVFCSGCRALLRPVPAPSCPRCGDPQQSVGGSPCRLCRRDPPPFLAARSLAVFEGSVRRAIHRLKFDGRREAGPILGGLLADFVRRTPVLRRPDLVVAVPLHPTRLRERGFNHAALLAAPVAEAMGAPLARSVLERVVRTLPQTELTRAERRANVRGAFRVFPQAAAGHRGQTVLLVDDVLTSGATVNECARTLRSAGLGAVYVATLARAEPPTPGSGGAAAAGSRATAPPAPR